MRLYKLIINDFRVRKVNSSISFYFTSGFSRSISAVFPIPSMVSFNTQYRTIFSFFFFNSEAFIYYIQLVRNTGGAFIREEAFIRGNTVTTSSSSVD